MSSFSFLKLENVDEKIIDKTKFFKLRLKTIPTPKPIPVSIPTPILVTPTINYNDLLFRSRFLEENNYNHRNLINCGSTCYLNSILQMLSYMPEFFEKLITIKDNEAEGSNLKKKINVFLSIFLDLYTESYRDKVNTNDRIDYLFFDFFKDERENKLRTQQDAAAFFRKILEVYKFDTNKDYTNFINLTIESTIKCPHGIKPGITIDTNITTVPNLEISIFNNSSTIQDLVNLNSIENVDYNNCVDDKGNKESIYKTDKDNKYIIIQLNLFEQDYITGVKRKKEIKLNLSEPLIIDSKIYNLYGSVIYAGFGDSGHYYFGKINNDGTVFVYDDLDTEVRLHNLNDFINTLNTMSYILIYKNSGLPAEPKPVEPKPVEPVPAEPKPCLHRTPDFEMESIKKQLNDILNSRMSREEKATNFAKLKRKLGLKIHPDKFRGTDPDCIKEANQKFNCLGSYDPYESNDKNKLNIDNNCKKT